MVQTLLWRKLYLGIFGHTHAYKETDLSVIRQAHRIIWTFTNELGYIIQYLILTKNVCGLLTLTALAFRLVPLRASSSSVCHFLFNTELSNRISFSMIYAYLCAL